MKKNLLLLVAVIAMFSLTGCKSLFQSEAPQPPKSWAPLMGYSRLAKPASDSTIQTVDNRVTIECSWEGYTTKTMVPDATQEEYFTYQAEQKIEAPQSGLKEYRVVVMDHLFGPFGVTWGVSVDGIPLSHDIQEESSRFGLFWLDRFGNIITTP